MRINVLILFAILALNSCRQNNNTNIKHTQCESRSENEIFEQFSRQFFTDSSFQMKRIIFPLESNQQDSIKTQINEKSMSIEFNKENWVMLKFNHFLTNDSIVIVNGIEFKKRVSRTNTCVVESIFIENSGFVTTMKFSIRNGKWYLVDYIECDN